MGSRGIAVEKKKNSYVKEGDTIVNWSHLATLLFQVFYKFRYWTVQKYFILPRLNFMGKAFAFIFKQAAPLL